MQDEFPDLQKKMMLYVNKLYRNKAQHLNYIEQLPENVHRDAPNSIRLENILKNVVFNRCLEIREEKRKPKLGEVLASIKKNL
jgi:DNA primase catalytic subunit